MAGATCIWHLLSTGWMPVLKENSSSTLIRNLRVLAQSHYCAEGFNHTQELGSIPKASTNHPNAQHSGKIDSQVTDFSTDNATEEKLALSFQPSGTLAQTWGWCVTFNWRDSGGKQKRWKEWSQWTDSQDLLPDGQQHSWSEHSFGLGPVWWSLYYSAIWNVTVCLWKISKLIFLHHSVTLEKRSDLHIKCSLYVLVLGDTMELISILLLLHLQTNLTLFFGPKTVRCIHCKFRCCK